MRNSGYNNILISNLKEAQETSESRNIPVGAVIMPVPDLWPFRENMVLMGDSDPIDQSNLNNGQIYDDQIIFVSKMTPGNKYINVESFKYKQPLFSCSGRYTEKEVKDLHDESQKCKKSPIARFYKKLIDVHNKKMKPVKKKGDHHPDFLERGHSVARDIGGSDVQSNIQTQSERSNRGIKKFVDLWQQKLYDVGYEKISFLDGIVFKDQIRDKFLVNPGPGFKVEVNGEMLDVPYAGYHVYSAWKGGENHLFCFFWPQYGLPNEGDVYTDWTAGKMWNLIKKYAIDPDVLADIIGFRFITETLKLKTKFVNVLNGNGACYGAIKIPDPDPNHI
jgi:hypothetical protein